MIHNADNVVVKSSNLLSVAGDDSVSHVRPFGTVLTLLSSERCTSPTNIRHVLKARAALIYGLLPSQ